MGRRIGAFQTISIYKAKIFLIANGVIENNNLTTFTFANWMVKVGTTTKSDVKQKEKKP